MSFKSDDLERAARDLEDLATKLANGMVSGHQAAQQLRDAASKLKSGADRWKRDERAARAARRDD